MVSRQAHNLKTVGSIPAFATNNRSVAQSGSASGLGPEGPRFESLYSDQEPRPYTWRIIGKIVCT